MQTEGTRFPVVLRQQYTNLVEAIVSISSAKDGFLSVSQMKLFINTDPVDIDVEDERSNPGSTWCGTSPKLLIRRVNVRQNIASVVWNIAPNFCWFAFTMACKSTRDDAAAQSKVGTSMKTADIPTSGNLTKKKRLGCVPFPRNKNDNSYLCCEYVLV